jgi:ribosomal protein S18 acetylase RimI-like enzyme
MGDGSDSIDRWDGNEHVPIRVRAATVADASAVAAVHVSSWEGAYRGMIPDEWLDRRTVARQTAIWEELLGGVGDPVDGRLPWAAVAEDGDTLIGFVSLNVPSRDADADARTAEISALYVEPGQWRRGAGTALIDAALAEASARGCTGVTLWVLEPNARARAFYERCGFADDGGRQTMGDSGPGELRMRRGL